MNNFDKNKKIELKKEDVQELIDCFNKKDLSNAEMLAEKLNIEFPDSFFIYYMMALIKENQKNTDLALKYYNKSIELNPKYSEAYNNLGNLYRQRGDYEKAINNYKQAIHFNNNFFIAYYNLGNSFKNIGKLSEAKENFKKALSIKPDFIESYNSLGDIFLISGNINNALEMFLIGTGFVRFNSDKSGIEILNKKNNEKN